VENLAVGVVHVLGDGVLVTVDAGKAVLGAGISTISGLWKWEKQELPPGTVPVESLTNGIVNAVGDGVNAVVETSKSTGTYISSAVGDKAPAIATAGLAVVFEFTGDITNKLFGGKK
jgi:hypothetical protein